MSFLVCDNWFRFFPSNKLADVDVLWAVSVVVTYCSKLVAVRDQAVENS